MSKEEELKNKFLDGVITEDELYEFALLTKNSSHVDCREILFKLITLDPDNLKARLLLARSFYDDGYMEYAVRELLEMKRRSSIPSIDRLLASFADFAKQFNISGIQQSASNAPSDFSNKSSGSNEKIVEQGEFGEIDLDDDLLTALDDFEDKQGSK